MNKYTFALVISGSIEAQSEEAAKSLIRVTFGMFDFVEGFQYKLEMRNPDGSNSGELLLPKEQAEKELIKIDKKFKCPADDRHLKGKVTMGGADCPYIGKFYCPFTDEILCENAVKQELPHCPFDRHLDEIV